MEDYLGNRLKIGDVVVFTAPKYRHLTKGVIIRFTAKQVLVEYINDWNFSNGLKKTYLSLPNFLIKAKDWERVE